MSDRNTGTELSLGAALRALPLATPPRDVWQTLAAELAPARVAPARRRYVLPAAIAAGLLAFAVALMMMSRERAAPQIATVAPAPASSVANGANAANGTSGKGTVADPETQLVALETRSQQLEHWLSETRAAAAPLPGQDLAAAAELEDLISLVDVELAASTRKEALPLWRYRVNLLEDLTALRYSNYRLAETLNNASNGAPPDRIN